MQTFLLIEHTDKKDESIVQLARDADVLIHDGHHYLNGIIKRSLDFLQVSYSATRSVGG